MIRRSEVSRDSALFFLVPLTAVLIGWLLRDEPMPRLAWIGLGLAGGVALAPEPIACRIVIFASASILEAWWESFHFTQE